MNILWLQDFVSVAQTGSFSLAAEKLYSSQANVSKHIQLLERETGLTLFDRSTRTIKITPAGSELLRHAETILREYDAFSATVNRFRSLDTALLRIVTVPIMHMYDLQHFVIDFQKNHANIQLEVTESDMLSVVAALSQKDYTIGILRECAVSLLPSQVSWTIFPFVHDEVGLLCSSQSPFAAAEAVSIRDCLDSSLVVLNSGYDEYRILLERLGFPAELYHPRVRFSSSSSLVGYVASGSGISIVTKGLANSSMLDSPNVVWRPFVEAPAFPLVIAVRESSATDTISLLVNELIGIPSQNGKE